MTIFEKYSNKEYSESINEVIKFIDNVARGELSKESITIDVEDELLKWLNDNEVPFELSKLKTYVNIKSFDIIRKLISYEENPEIENAKCFLIEFVLDGSKDTHSTIGVITLDKKSSENPSNSDIMRLRKFVYGDLKLKIFQNPKAIQELASTEITHSNGGYAFLRLTPFDLHTTKENLKELLK